MLQLKGKPFARRMREGGELFGLFIRLTDPTLIEVLGASNLDFVVLDVEHGSIGKGEINLIVAAAERNGLSVLIRLPEADFPNIHHAVAVGAAGVIVSHVSSGKEAKRIGEFAHTSALERSYAGMSRSSGYRAGPWDEYRDHMRENFVVLAQIDEIHGAEAAAEIAEVEEIDAIFVGSLSLRISLTERGESQSNVDAIIDSLYRTLKDQRRPIGSHLVDLNQKSHWADRGVSLFVVGNELSILRNGVSQILQTLRARG